MGDSSVAPRRQGFPPPAAAADQNLSALPNPRLPWWRRRFVDPVATQLTQGITPEKISLSLAVGSICAFFPILGLATPLCILAAAGLRLNHAIVQLVNGVTSPLYPLVVLGFIQLGHPLLGATPADLRPGFLLALLRRDPAQFLHRLGPLAGHAVLGWAIVAPFWVAAGYFCLLPALRLLAPAPRLRAECLP